MSQLEKAMKFMANEEEYCSDELGASLLLELVHNTPVTTVGGVKEFLKLIPFDAYDIAAHHVLRLPTFEEDDDYDQIEFERAAYFRNLLQDIYSREKFKSEFVDIIRKKRSKFI
ncbi:hypothetical protein [Alkalihalophilus marmarensis]|uniref:hypothetical protein n=1 Tax=Alkalihalophilus marmarensis TaxID=521377 RepID=UPI002DB87160|nr:hypothetical protein [Alkalihalophilus marmarensis]MEC2074214.1 hypothetical protein [Alkalihalophilus marmarensis]